MHFFKLFATFGTKQVKRFYKLMKFLKKMTGKQNREVKRTKLSILLTGGIFDWLWFIQTTNRNCMLSFLITISSLFVTSLTNFHITYDATDQLV